MANETLINNGVDIMDIHFKMLLEGLPAIILLGVLGTIGMVGNVFSIVFFHRETATPFTVLVTGLAVFDFIVCLWMYVSAVEFGVNVLFSHKAVCKLLKTVSQCFVVASVFLLTFISIERYRKVCKPYKGQLTVRGAKCAICITVVCFSVLGARNCILYDANEVVLVLQTNTTSAVVGHSCSPSTDPHLKSYVFASSVFDLVFILTCILVIIISYTFILRTLFLHRKKISAMMKKKSNDKTGSDNTKVSSESVVRIDLSSETDIYESQESNKAPVNVEDRGKSGRKENIRESEKKATFTMLIVSVCLLVCFIPFFLVSIWSDGDYPKWVIYIMLKTPYVNSFINPIVYYVLNLRFKTFVNKALRCSEID